MKIQLSLLVTKSEKIFIIKTFLFLTLLFFTYGWLIRTFCYISYIWITFCFNSLKKHSSCALYKGPTQYNQKPFNWTYRLHLWNVKFYLFIQDSRRHPSFVNMRKKKKKRNESSKFLFISKPNILQKTWSSTMVRKCKN